MLKNNLLTLLLSFFIMAMSGCSGGGSDSNTQSGSTATLSGYTQKGPFLKGSSVTVYKIGDDFERTATKAEANITDDLGNYTLDVNWEGLSEIVVSGYYYDEVTNTQSVTPITLHTYTWAVYGKNIITNINVLTEIASTKIKALLKEGKDFTLAKQEVMNDLSEILGIDFASLYAGELDMLQLDGTNASLNAELLRISAALLHSSDPIADLNELLDAYAQGGVDALKETPAYATLQQNRADLNMSVIVDNLEDQNLTNPGTIIPPLVTVELPKTQLADINITLDPKGSVQFTTQLLDDNVTFSTPATHGSVSVYFIGNEFVDFKYVSDDCFVGVESFEYENATQKGRVNVTIQTPAYTTAINDSQSLKNTQTISSQYLMADNSAYLYNITKQPQHGTATLFSIGNEAIHYSYDPVDTYEGIDSFEYTLTHTINECTYDSVGKIDLSITGVTPLVTTQTIPNVKTLLSAPRTQDNAQFGYAVAIEGDTTVVSEPTKQLEGSTTNEGEVYIYQKTDISDELIQTLSVKDFDTNGEVIGNFGKKLSLKDGYLAIVTGDLQQYIDLPVKRVMIYKQEDNATFTYLTTIEENIGDGNEIYSVSINKNYLVISADGTTDTLSIFTNNNGQFSLLQTLTPTQSNTRFGYQSALMDDLIIFSEPYASTDLNGTMTQTGAVYVYKDINNSLTLTQTLDVPSELQKYYGLFGYIMSSDENYLAIGATNAELDGKSNAGKVYVYAKDGSTLSKISEIQDTTATTDGKFGTSVAISENYLALSLHHSSNDDGVYLTDIYQYTGDGNYSRLARYDAKDYAPSLQSGYKESTEFGYALAISSSKVVSGARSAIAWNQFDVKTYKGGRAYIIDANSLSPSIVNYAPYLKHYENASSINGIYSAPQETTLTLSGDDASLFSFISYYPKYYISQSVYDLSYDTPSDQDSNNLYELNVNLTMGDTSLVYPITVEMMQNITAHASENSNEALYNINNLWPYDASNNRISSVLDYAKRVELTGSYALASEQNGIFVFDRTLWDDTNKELLDLHPAKITLSDASTSSPTKTANFLLFGSNDSEAAVDVSTQNNNNDYNHSINIYDLSTQTLKQTIEFYANSKDGLYPAKDYDVVSIKDIQMQNDHLFVSYRHSFKHDDDNDSLDLSYDKDRIAVFTKTQNGYETTSQFIDVPTYLDNHSYIGAISVSGEYLALTYMINEMSPANTYAYNAKVYKLNRSSGYYELSQTINFDSSKGAINALDLSGEFLTLRRNYTAQYSANEIYKRDSQGVYQHIQTLEAVDAGGTNVLNDNLGVARTSGQYLVMKFSKYLESSDSYIPLSSSATTIGSGGYLGVFKYDTQTEKFRFLKAFTALNAATDFGYDYDILDNSVVTNRYINNSSSTLHMFEFNE